MCRESKRGCWKYFECEIERFIQTSEGNLMELLNNHECAQESCVYPISQCLKNTCAQAKTRNTTTALAHDSGFIDQFNVKVKPFLPTTSVLNWTPWCNQETDSLHLYQFSMSPGYAEKEIKICKTSKWLFHTLGIEREKTKIDVFKNVPDTINTLKSLVELLNGFENVKLCDGCGLTETFKELDLDNKNDKSW